MLEIERLEKDKLKIKNEIVTLEEQEKELEQELDAYDKGIKGIEISKNKIEEINITKLPLGKVSIKSGDFEDLKRTAIENQSNAEYYRKLYEDGKTEKEELKRKILSEPQLIEQQRKNSRLEKFEEAFSKLSEEEKERIMPKTEFEKRISKRIENIKNRISSEKEHIKPIKDV